MKQKRKRLYVDKAVQGSLAKRIGYHWLFFFGIVIALKVLTNWTVNPTASFGEMMNHLVRTNGLFLCVLMLLLPSFIFDAVKMSNRFAGPMVRLKNELKRAAESGEYREISFREGDFWMDIANSYNEMIRSVNEKLGNEPVDDEVINLDVDTSNESEEVLDEVEAAFETPAK